MWRVSCSAIVQVHHIFQTIGQENEMERLHVIVKMGK